MFLKIDSITRLTPFPTLRLLGQRSPVFDRYYEVAKTASARFLTSLFARIGYPDLSQCFAYAGFETPPTYPDLGQPVALILVFYDQGNRRLSHVPVKPALHLPCSQTPDGLLHLPLACFQYCSRFKHNENSIGLNRTNEALSHSFCNHCLRFMQASLPTMQDSLPADC